VRELTPFSGFILVVASVLSFAAAESISSLFFGEYMPFLSAFNWMNASVIAVHAAFVAVLWRRSRVIENVQHVIVGEMPS
jgi:hypothetical protein